VRTKDSGIKLLKYFIRVIIGHMIIGIQVSILSKKEKKRDTKRKRYTKVNRKLERIR
jgi:hypothetical protein